MGDTQELLQKAGLSENTAKAIETGEKIFSKVCWAYGIAKSVGSLLGLWGDEAENNVVQQQLTEIQNKLTSIQAAISAIAANQVAESLRAITADVQTAMNEDNGPRDALSHTKNYIKNPNREELKLSFYDACEDLPGKLRNLGTNDGFWNHIYTQDAFYSDVWSGSLKPPEFENNTSPNDIWDYRISLPAFLEAVASWLMVLGAADKEYRETWIYNSDTLQIYAQQLTKVYCRILSSFRLIRPPSFDEMCQILPAMDNSNFRHMIHCGELYMSEDEIKNTSGSYIGDGLVDWLLKNYIPGGSWRLSGYTYGAVETYSGYSCIDAYPQEGIHAGLAYLKLHCLDSSLFDDDMPSVHPPLIVQPELFNAFYEKFILKHTLRTWKQSQQLYKKLGLPALWNTIKQLYAVLGKTPPEIPAEYSKYTAWSVREVYSIIPDSIKGNPEPGQPISLRTMASMLESPLPSLRQMLLLNE